MPATRRSSCDFYEGCSSGLNPRIFSSRFTTTAGVVGIFNSLDGIGECSCGQSRRSHRRGGTDPLSIPFPIRLLLFGWPTRPTCSSGRPVKYCCVACPLAACDASSCLFKSFVNWLFGYLASARFTLSARLGVPDPRTAILSPSSGYHIDLLVMWLDSPSPHSALGREKWQRRRCRASPTAPIAGTIATCDRAGHSNESE